MPTVLGPTLAVAALLPLATPRPQPDHVASTHLRGDVLPTEDSLRNCIEADSALVEKLNGCLQDDSSFEENSSRRTHISFGLLDEDWNKLQLLQAVLPDHLILKGKLIRAFRALMTSFYRTHFARLSSKVGNRDTAGSSNATGHAVNDPTQRTGTSIGVPTLPTTTDGTTTADENSNNIVYEGAGSDPKVLVVQPPLDGDSSGVTFNTNGPYSVSDTIFKNSSYERDSKYESSTLYEQKVTNSEIENITNILRDLVGTDIPHSSTYELSSTARSYSQDTESSEPKNKSSPSTDNISQSEESYINLTDLPYNKPNKENNEGRGTDIAENEIFPPIEIHTTARSEENRVHTKETPNPSNVGKITISNSTSSSELKSDVIPTESSYHSSHIDKSTSSYSFTTPNHEEQSGKGYNPEEPPDPVPPGFHEDLEGNTVEENLPINPTTSPADPKRGSGSNLPSKIDGDKQEINPSGKDTAGNNQSVISNIDPTSSKEITVRTTPSAIFYELYETNLVDKTSIKISESQQTDKLLDVTEIYSNTENDLTIKVDDSKNAYSTDISSIFNHLSTIPSPPTDNVIGIDENNDHVTDTFIISTTSTAFKSEQTISPYQETNDDKYELTEKVIKVNTIPLVTDITSQKPENKGQNFQTTSVVTNDEIEYTTGALQPESDKEYGGYPNVPDDRIYSYSSTGSVVLVTASPQANIDDNVSLVSEIKSDQNLTGTGPLDGDRNKTSSVYDNGITTEEYLLPFTSNNTTSDIERANRTELKNKLHAFSIPLPEIRKTKQENVIVNGLRIFPPSNNHILTSQPSYNRGCLSQNDCVRVGSSLISKQRRTPLGNLETGEQDDVQFRQFPMGDTDSVLWWHKMRALKKKFR